MNIKFVSWQVAVVLIVVFLFIRQYVFPELSSYPEISPRFSVLINLPKKLKKIIGEFIRNLKKPGYIKATPKF